MQVEEETGSIMQGKRANLILTQPIPSIAYLPYAFGTNLVQRVMVNGAWL
jgi:imidazolonepropionase